MSDKLKLYSAGLTEQDNMVVSTAAKLLSYDDVGFVVNDGEISKAHLLIIDEDSQSGKQALRQSRAGQVKLLVSSNPKMAKNIIGLQRPIDLSTLKSVLKKLYAKLHAQLSTQKINAAAQPKTQAVLELKDSLFNILIETKLKKRVLHITCDELPDIFIDGCNQCLATTANETELEKILSLALDQITFYKLKPKSFAVHSNEMNVQSLHNILWLAGIRCSKGRLLPGHSLDKPFRLKAWPNFTRSSFIAEHLKLAAILAKQPMSMHQLAEATGVKMAEVVNFYNAALAVDLIIHEQGNNNLSGNSRSRTLEQQSLFSRIAKRLSLKGIF